MTVFSKIIHGEIPCYKIAENEHFFAFLDIRPLSKGHTLVVPKIEVDYLFHLSDSELGDLMVFSKQIAIAMQQVFTCKRIGMVVMGLEVPHAHVHLIPINSESDMDFAHHKLQLSAEEMNSIAQAIRQAL